MRLRCLSLNDRGLFEETWKWGSFWGTKNWKKYDFLALNRDFSHEIPQQFSRFPPQLEKIWFFCRKIVIFHTNYPKNFRASLRNWKKYDFFVVKSWFFTRNTTKIYAPPSARRDFFKRTPSNLKSWIRPWAD